MAKPAMKSPVAVRVIRQMKEGILAMQERERASAMPPPGQVPYYPYPYPPGAEKPKEEEEEKIKGIRVSTEGVSGAYAPAVLSRKDQGTKDIRLSYPLIPRNPAQGEKVYAYADIRWNNKSGELIYYLVEPQISKYDDEFIEKTKRKLEEVLDIDFFKLGQIKAKDLLRDEINRILALDTNIPPDKRDSIMYYLERDIVGMGKIEPFMNDPNIEDISCDGIGIPLYVYHRDSSIGSLKTNTFFTDEDSLNSFVVKMAQRARKGISIAEPLLDAALPDGSRMQATLGTDIARRGSNFTIRRFSEQPLTPTHMLSFGTLNSIQLAYLWLAIENGQSILISGGTATGKTSLLNALSLFIRPSLKIVSIEDTPELRLPHPHWIPEVARTPLSIKGDTGEVSLFDLLKSSLRQRPDYIVMGEVRGKEAFVLFQQIATGHPSIATIHAASITQLVDRLTTPPISLPPSLIENINIIVFLTLSRIDDRYMRRANNILEITGIDGTRPVTKDIFRWKPDGDEFKTKETSIVLRNISDRLALNEDELKSELVRRKEILEWMYIQGIYDYREVARLISAYYSNPQRVMDVVQERL